MRQKLQQNRTDDRSLGKSLCEEMATIIKWQTPIENVDIIYLQLLELASYIIVKSILVIVPWRTTLWKLFIILCRMNV